MSHPLHTSSDELDVMTKHGGSRGSDAMRTEEEEESGEDDATQESKDCVTDRLRLNFTAFIP